MRVLVVDDDIDIRMVCQTALLVMAEPGEFQVQEAGSAEGALAMILEDPPDVVLLDIMLPEVDGFELLQRLRGNSAATDLPVLMLSAKVGLRDHLTAFEHGADGYIGKPFDVDEMLDAVREVVARSPEERRAEREREVARLQAVRER